MTVTALLPEEFADLEPFAADWCLPSERERLAKRYASTMPDMQAFYDAITPRAEDAMTYLDQYTLDDPTTCPHGTAITSRPAEQSSCARIEPVQPRPMITASFFGSFCATRRAPL